MRLSCNQNVPILQPECAYIATRLCLSCNQNVPILQPECAYLTTRLCLSCNQNVPILQAECAYLATRMCLSCKKNVPILQPECVYLATRMCLSCNQDVSILQAECVYLPSMICLSCKHLSSTSCLPYNEPICFSVMKKSSVRYPILPQIHRTLNIHTRQAQIHHICSLKGLKQRYDYWSKFTNNFQGKSQIFSDQTV